VRLLTALCLGLLAPSLAAAATEPAAPLVRPGSLQIALGAAGTSTLPLDSAALAYSLCNDLLGEDGNGRISARGECDLSVGSPKMGWEVEWIEGQGASFAVWMRPVSSERWKGKPLSTTCGLWDISLDLDPKPQPLSRLALEASPVAGPVQGVFAGVMQLAVRFHFVLRDKGKAYELPAQLPLELKGHWAAVPEGGPSLGEGASNLVLYAGVAGGQWASFPDCGTWGGTLCHVCLEAHPDVLGPLEPGSEG
jgi:hypothetical protein